MKKLHLLLFLTLFAFTASFANTEKLTASEAKTIAKEAYIAELYAVPYNSNVLIQRGVDPQILNLSVTTFRQNVAYKVQAKYSEQCGVDTMEQVFNILYDPYAVYGIDIKLEVPKKDLKNIDVKELRGKLDETMGLQSYLQTRALYDLDSLQILSEENGNAVITFKFKDEAIPRELKYFKQLRGYIYISDNTLQKIVLKNEIDFKHNSIEVQSYEKTVGFSKLPLDGGYLLKSVNIKIAGLKEKLDYKSETHADVVKYWDEKQEVISSSKELVNSDFTINEDYETINVEIDRIFPLYGKEARKEGYDLPKAFGVSLISMFQNTTMHMTSFEIEQSKIDFNKIIDGDSTYENLTYAPLIRADMWLLPFLNVGLLLGVTDTSTDVTLHSSSGLSLGPIEIIPPNSKLRLDTFKTNSLLYGVGVTVAGGVGNYFSTIDFQYITSYTSEADVSVEMLVITPLIGYNFTSVGTRVFIGAQYQDLAESLTFDIIADGQRLSGKVGLYSEDWAGVIGANYDFTRHWGTNLLLSYGEDRTNMTLTIGYRW